MKNFHRFLHTALFAWCCLALLPVASPADIDQDALAKLSKKYQLTIVAAGPTFPVKTFHGSINGKAAAAAYVESYVKILTAEWNLYPPELIKRTQLRRIILCANLSFAGQLRTAIPDFEHNNLYFDVERGRYSDHYTRAVIHHEFFHIIDLRNGTLYKDERWAALLPKGVKYGSGGKNAQDDATMSLLTEKTPGFLNKYAATSVEEDKAETFAHMIVSAKTVAARAEKDAILRAKTVRMKEFFERFCPQVDEKFWEAAAKLPRR